MNCWLDNNDCRLEFSVIRIKKKMGLNFAFRMEGLLRS